MTGGINGPPVLNGAAYTYPKTTLSALRDRLLCLLGFPDPLTSPDAQTKTLVLLREILFRRTGNRYAAGANPPGVDKLMDNFINEAQQTIFRTVEFDKGGVAYPTLMTADSDPTQIDYVPVETLAIGLAKAHFGQTDSKLYFDQLSKYLSDRAIRRPPKVTAMATEWLILAQNKLYHQYKMLRTELWWPITLQAGSRIYDVPYDASSALDFRTVSQVWILENSVWTPLKGGINPAQFTTTTRQRPTHFEFREYLELFPEPDKVYTVFVKGHRGLLVFAADGDFTTLDPDIILLQALVWGKTHFKHADAGVFDLQLTQWIGRLNSGRFAGLRFIPRETGSEEYSLPYPQVTFPR